MACGSLRRPLLGAERGVAETVGASQNQPWLKEAKVGWYNSFQGIVPPEGVPGPEHKALIRHLAHIKERKEEMSVLADLNDAGRIEITSDYTYKDRCKMVPGARWDRTTQKWHVPCSWAACKQLRGIFGAELEVGDRLRDWAYGELVQRIKPALLLREQVTVSDGPGRIPHLYGFQQAGVEFLLAARGAILGDPMGAGKTVQAITAARQAALLPALVVCPNSMKRTWAREIEKWWPNTPVHVVEGTAGQRAKTLREAAMLVKTCPIHKEGSWDKNPLNSGSLLSVTQSERTTPMGSVKPAISCKLEKTNDELLFVIQTENTMPKASVEAAMKEIYGKEILGSRIDNTLTIDVGGSTRLTDLLQKSIANILNLQTTCANLDVGKRQLISTIVIRLEKSEESCAQGVINALSELTKMRTGSIEPKCTCPWIVINWESARLHSRLAPYGSIALTDKEKEAKELNQIPFILVIADEAHRMKDPRSKQTRAVWACGHAPSVEFRWALTGTPLTNAPDTLYPILHFLDPQEWPSKTAFIDRYCLSTYNPWGALEVFGIKPELEKEFFSIFDPRFRRMPKEVVLPELPPIQRIRRYVNMHTKQKKAYDAMAENLYTQVDTGTLVASNPIAQLTRLTQFASAYCEIKEEGWVRLTDPSNKLDALMADLEDYLADGEGVVVFAQSRQLIEMAAARLEKAGISHSVIKGGQTQDVRQAAIDDFQNEKVDVILVVIAAGGVGITLTRARIAIFLQRSWSQVDMQQAEGRVHRIGSEKHESVQIIDYISNGTIELHQLDILADKHGKLEEIVRDAAAIRRLLKGKDE